MKRPVIQRNKLSLLVGLSVAFAASQCALEYGKVKPSETISLWEAEDIEWIEEEQAEVVFKLPEPPVKERRVKRPALTPQPKPVVMQTKQTASLLPDFELPENTSLFPEESYSAPDIGKPTDFPDVQPQFPGGDSLLYVFLNNHLKYPAFAKENKIEGPVYVKFTIAANGEIDPRSFEVLRSPHKSLSAEAIRVVKKMPRWIPGKQQLKNVPVYMKLPVHFRLR